MWNPKIDKLSFPRKRREFVKSRFESLERKRWQKGQTAEKATEHRSGAACQRVQCVLIYGLWLSIMNI